MVNYTLPANLQTVLHSSNSPDIVFTELLPLLGKLLDCDRCFLYLRNPHNKMGKATHCWRRSEQFPEIKDPDWKPEPDGLPESDPMFAAALNTAPTIFVDDVVTADPQVVNRKFEQQNFGHQALIHAHLCRDNLLWGILQPCIFGQPRHWTETDRAIVTNVVELITPMAITYVNDCQLEIDYAAKHQQSL